MQLIKEKIWSCRVSSRSFRACGNKGKFKFSHISLSRLVEFEEETRQANQRLFDESGQECAAERSLEYSCFVSQ